MGAALVEGRLPPGSALEIVGVDFSPEETVQVLVEGSGGRWNLGTLTAGPDGHFAVVLQLPADIQAGLYNVDVVSSAGVTFRELLQVDPAAPPAAPTITPGDALIESASPAFEDIAWQLAPLGLLGAAVVGLALLFVRRRRETDRSKRATAHGADAHR